MKRIGQLRETVVTILNELFGDRENGIVFNSSDTKKNSGGKKNRSKHEQINSVNWSARCRGKYYVTVRCIGMTMLEFIDEYRNQKVILFIREKPFQESSFKLIEYLIYKNTPTWKTTGFVLNVDTEKNILRLKFEDILDPVELQITKQTPLWLLDKNYNIEFSCKIYPFWRHNNLHLINDKNSDLSKVWKSFRMERSIPDWEYEIIKSANTDSIP